MTCAAREPGRGGWRITATLPWLLMVAAWFPAQSAAAEVPRATAAIEGRVALEGQVIAGVTVYAYRSFDDLTSFHPFIASLPTGDNGKFSLSVPAGSWWLAAKRRTAGAGDGPLAVDDLFSFHGSNPITTAGNAATHVGFSLVRKTREPVDTALPLKDSGAVAGIVTYQGQPLAGVRVSLFADASENFRGLEHASAPPTGPTGGFRLDFLPEGKYYLVARKRATGAQAGPITDGDYFGYFLENPVAVRNGILKEVVFPIGSKAGEIGKEDSLFRVSDTRIRGRITDQAGRPVKGVYAFAYRDKNMARRRPDVISRESDDSGDYVLHLSGGGTWYVGARSGYGEGPAIGEWYGRYQGSDNHSVVVGEGQTIEGVDVGVAPVPP